MAIKDKWLEFNGVDGYVNAGRDSDAYRVKRDITLEAWIWAEPYAGDSRLMGIVSKLRNDSGSASGYGLMLMEGKLIFMFYSATTSARLESSASAVGAGAWHHVAATYDGVNMKIYVDGYERGSCPVGTAVDISYANEVDLYIGRGLTTQQFPYFKGKICEVRIWDVARTQAQLTENKERSLDSSVANLRARFPLDDGSTLQANDMRNGLLASLHGTVKPGPVAGQTTLTQPDLQRPTGLIDTSGVLAAALDKLNRKSITGLLKELAGQIKAQAGDIKDVRSDLDAHTNVTNHNELIDNRVEIAIQNLLTQDEFRKVAEDLGRLQRELEIVRNAALALDTNEMAAVTKAISDALRHPDLGKLILGATIRVNNADVTFAALLNRIARRVEVVSTEFTYSATDITSAIFTMSEPDPTVSGADKTKVTFNATRTVEGGNEIVYTFRANSLQGIPAVFEVRLRRSSWTDTLNAGTPQAVNLTLDEHDAYKHSNVYYDLNLN